MAASLRGENIWSDDQWSLMNQGPVLQSSSFKIMVITVCGAVITGPLTRFTLLSPPPPVTPSGFMNASKTA